MAPLLYGLNSNVRGTKTSPTSIPGDPQIFPARVKNIILNDKDKNLFKSKGEWASIGMIFYDSVKDPSIVDTTNSDYAIPLFPNIKNYPLKNELVYIMSLPYINSQSNTTSTIHYYFNPINCWSSVHHNALPDEIFDKERNKKKQRRDYRETEVGSVRQAEDKDTEINLGETFEENMEIRNLLPYEGDIIFEGRWGNSIRFSSTVEGYIPNTWSKKSNPGPITIIRNGQPDKIESQTWIPITEDINSDKSSIYLTTNQLIPIKVASSNYTSYDKSNKEDKKSYTPSNPKDYQQNQIILNSGRLLFNAYDDSILLSSLNSINLNSKGTVNIDVTKKFVVSGEKNPQIYLGNSQDKETEPLLLGDETVKIIDTIMSEMINVYEAIGVVVGNMAIPLADVNSSALSSLKIIKEKQKELENLKQKNIRIRKNP